MTPIKTPHLEASLQRDIDLIRGKVKDMFQLDHRALVDVLQALLENNRQRAYSVILRDQRIDELEKEIDRLCLEFLVRQQPVALHLRFAYVTIKINQELERIGDYAESIARQVLKISNLNVAVPKPLFEEIASLATPMLESAVQAFLTQNAELARQTMEIEEKVDELRDRINAELYRLQRDNKIPMPALTPLLTVARRFERVSDQAKNICEEVLYMCTGEYAKHVGMEVYRILFIDDHNSCRSQMAEGIANAIGLPKLVFSSAGLDPKPLDPRSVDFLQGKSIDISRQTPKSLERIPNLEHYHILIALSKDATKAFPKPPTKTICLDWNVQDPSTIQGDASAVRTAYEETYNEIRNHIHDLSEAILGDKID